MKLAKWFPPGDPLAASLARLCILREDYMLETRGLMDIPIDQLDLHSPKWRKLYFLRKSVQTLQEIRGTLETLRRDADFKRLLSEQSSSEREKFEAFGYKMGEAHGLLSDLRNRLGGHVLHGSVQNTLLSMNSDCEGLIELGAVLQETHYKFAGELVLEMMLARAPEEERMPRFVKYLETLSGLVESLSVIDVVVTWYAIDRKLFPEFQ